MQSSKRPLPKFVDVVTTGCLDISSEWRVSSSPCESTECQTDPDLYQFTDMDTQSGPYSDIYQEFVSHTTDGSTLLDRFTEKFKNKSALEWKETIENGFISVDYEIITNPDYILREEELVEYVDYKRHVHTQTISTASDMNISEGKDSEGYISTYESEALNIFLLKVVPLVESTLLENEISTAFDGYALIEETGSEDVVYWKKLSVDLEKRKVTYPDWTSAKYYPARILSCSLTRNKERVYDVEFEDGGMLPLIREEYLRTIEEKTESRISEEIKRKDAEKRKARASTKLSEGIRVHVKVAGKTGVGKYLPGRIVKSHKGGLYDVEVEGSKVFLFLFSSLLCFLR